MTDQVSFDVTKSDHELIRAIVDRAMTRPNIAVDRMTLMMDLTAVHANGCPLDLSGLLDAPGFDFSHDIVGISQHLNRQTGRLEDCFFPRYAMRD